VCGAEPATPDGPPGGPSGACGARTCAGPDPGLPGALGFDVAPLSAPRSQPASETAASQGQGERAHHRHQRVVVVVLPVEPVAPMEPLPLEPLLPAVPELPPLDEPEPPLAPMPDVPPELPEVDGLLPAVLDPLDDGLLLLPEPMAVPLPPAEPDVPLLVEPEAPLVCEPPAAPPEPPPSRPQAASDIVAATTTARAAPREIEEAFIWKLLRLLCEGTEEMAALAACLHSMEPLRPDCRPLLSNSVGQAQGGRKRRAARGRMQLPWARRLPACAP
jgi:hypothetical protein